MRPSCTTICGSRVEGAENKRTNVVERLELKMGDVEAWLSAPTSS